MALHQQNKEFGVYHWDTFDNETLLLEQFDTKEQAETWVEKRYGGRIRNSGADQVDIVNSHGIIVRKYSVG